MLTLYIDSHVSDMEDQFSYLNQSVNKLTCILRLRVIITEC